MAYSAEREGSGGRCTNSPTSRTRKKTMDLARVMEPRKTQLTEVRSNWQRLMKMRAGREKVPTKVPRPLDSTSLMKLNFPAMKPRKMMPKHWEEVGNYSGCCLTCTRAG